MLDFIVGALTFGTGVIFGAALVSSTTNRILKGGSNGID